MSEAQNRILIGYLTEVRGDGMDARVAEDHVTAAPIIKIGNEEILAGHVGSYILIRQAHIRVLALVFKMWEKDRFNQDGARQTDRFISLIPVGEIQSDGLFVRGVRHFPTPGAEVFAVGIQEII